MACAVSTFTATPRDVTSGEIGTVATIVAANSRPMIDPDFILISPCISFETSAITRELTYANQRLRSRDRLDKKGPLAPLRLASNLLPNSGAVCAALRSELWQPIEGNLLRTLDIRPTRSWLPLHCAGARPALWPLR